MDDADDDDATDADEDDDDDGDDAAHLLLKERWSAHNAVAFLII